MDIYIYGAGKRGRELYNKIQNTDVRCHGFIDKYVKGQEIVQLCEVKFDDIIIISIANENIATQVAGELRAQGYKKIFWYYYLDSPIYSEREFIEKECVQVLETSKPVIEHVEMHISDKCNLNCVGCAHYSPIFTEIGESFEKKISDVRKLSQKKIFIRRFYILGGEPFLNLDIDKYIVEIKRILPQTELEIVTNGLLLLKVSDEILKTISEYGVTISISEYEPTHKIMGDIERRLQEFSVKYIVRRYDTKNKFIKPLSLIENSKYPKTCICKGCVNIWNGKIARCPILMYIDKFNEVFNTNLPNTGIVDINNAPIGDELIQFLKCDVPLCAHCVSNEIPWSRCNKVCKLDDFAINE